MLIQTITDINSAVKDFVWGAPMIVLMSVTGVLMTILTGGFQFVRIGHWFKSTIGAIFSDKEVIGHTKDRSISQFQSLCTALAATVGTGNIVGVASAIISGGPGAVFWMWIMALFSMMTNYSENVLGIFYRRKNSVGEWSGGAMYYLRDGLGAKKGCKTIGMVLAALFSVFCFLASFGIGNMTQVNSISGNIHTAFGVPAWITGIAVTVLAGLVILGGIKRIANVTEKIVPFMVLIYIAGSIIIFFTHLYLVPKVFVAIFKSAWGMRAAGGGIVGFGIKQAVELGMKRGIFSNEAGLGSSVMVHSSSNVKEPVRQGMWGIFEVFADTIVVCTLTAFTVLTSGITDLETGVTAEVFNGINITGSNLVNTVFSSTFGKAGSCFVAVGISLFAFSTVLGWSHYGSKACEFLFGERAVIIYKVIFVLAVFGGAVMGQNLAWDIADTLNGLMAIPNLIGVLTLSPVVAAITKNYVDRKFNNKDIEPMLSVFEDIQTEAAQAVKNGAE